VMLRAPISSTVSAYAEPLYDIDIAPVAYFPATDEP